MFCEQCGEKLQESWKVCPKCSWQLKNMEEKQYVFFTQIKRERREKINSVFRMVHIIVGAFVALMIAVHIYNEIQRAENYKVLLYVMRFICMCGPYLVLEFVVAEIKWIVLLRKNQVSEFCPIRAIIVTELIYIFMGVIAGWMFISPSIEQEWKMMAAVANDSVIDYLTTMKEAIALLLLSAVVKYIQEKRMEPKKV